MKYTLAVVALLLCCSAALGQATTSYKFDFGTGKTRDGYTRVKSDAIYSKELGYGFDLGSTVQGAGEYVTSDKPFFFSVALPEGTYRVTVTLGDAKADSVATVKAEAHRLMLEEVKTPAGMLEKRSFLVNTRTIAMTPPIPNNAPGRAEVTLGVTEKRNAGGLTWDDKLTLEFLNNRPCLNAIDIEKVDNAITVFVAGDSTVTDQPGNTTTSWGQMLPNFLKNDVVVANYAESGETMKSFITALRLDKLLGNMKQGDYLLIQFGHNDSKASWPQTYVEANSTYKLYLKVFIGEARRRGATPVIISPMERRNGANGNTHGAYPDAVAAVAKEENCAYINLHDLSKTFYQALGENVGAAFNDATHHSRYGAYELAKIVAQGLVDNKLDLANHLQDNFNFNAAKPDPVDMFKVPQSGGGRGGPIAGN